MYIQSELIKCSKESGLRKQSSSLLSCLNPLLKKKKKKVQIEAGDGRRRRSQSSIKTTGKRYPRLSFFDLLYARNPIGANTQRLIEASRCLEGRMYAFGIRKWLCELQWGFFFFVSSISDLFLVRSCFDGFCFSREGAMPLYIVYIQSWMRIEQGGEMRL